MRMQMKYNIIQRHVLVEADSNALIFLREALTLYGHGLCRFDLV